MTAALNPTPTVSLADDLQALYAEVRASLGEEDLAHIRKVADYSKAIKARSRELLQHGGKPEAFQRGVVLYMLHVLLEFSELGHNIMHGSYDELPGAEAFRSDRWQWDFVTDPREWRVMHHQNHHPFTNIVGKDHDLGYSIARLLPYQNWFGHHALQPGVLVLLLLHAYHFSVYTATSAARTEGRPLLSRDTFERTFQLIADHARRNYVQEPLASGRRFFHTLFGNYLGTALGYDLTILILILEHHAPNVQVFPDPGPGESRDAYFRRQILATTNFVPMPRLDAFFQRILDEEVNFAAPPPFEVFYGGLTTHLEHHLFPDLPCNRQREIVPRVREICLAHGLPYNVVALDDVLPAMFKGLFRWAAPLDAERAPVLRSLIRQPALTVRRLSHGLRYRAPSASTYVKLPRFFNAEARVIEARPLIGGDALLLRLKRPHGWDAITWEAGAYLSLRLEIDGDTWVRQYSLINDSATSDTLDVTVKRVKGGRVSNYINDFVRTGDRLTLVNPPQNGGAFQVDGGTSPVLLVAGGVGITPLISLMRQQVRAPLTRRYTLLYFNRNPQQILFETELRVLAARHGIQVHFICDSRPAERRDLLESRPSSSLLQQCVPDLAAHTVYACAPPALLDALGGWLAEAGIPASRFHTEAFSAPTLQRVRTGVMHTVRFARSGIDVEIDDGTTLLEASRLAGLQVPTGCERGLCKACVCTKLAGHTQAERDSGQTQTRIPLCTALPDSAITLDL